MNLLMLLLCAHTVFAYYLSESVLQGCALHIRISAFGNAFEAAIVYEIMIESSVIVEYVCTIDEVL